MKFQYAYANTGHGYWVAGLLFADKVIVIEEGDYDDLWDYTDYEDQDSFNELDFEDECDADEHPMYLFGDALKTKPIQSADICDWSKGAVFEIEDEEIIARFKEFL